MFKTDRPSHLGNASTRGATSSGAAARKPTAVIMVLAATIVAVPTIIRGADAAPRNKPNQIRSEYIPPKNPVHQIIYARLQQGQTLEHLQKLLSPLRLPYPLTLKVASCDGIANAWYEHEVITVCYELLTNILSSVAMHDLPTGVSGADTIMGPTLDVFLHETGHAVFNMLQIPVLGRQEDAADQFSAYIMLRLSKGEARRMILGSAYHYAIQVPGPEVISSRDLFSDEHSLPTQRAFNVLCIAYGADKKLFADIVENGLLPKQRAENCEMEYEDLAFAMMKLISPHIDKRAARKFHEVWARTVSVRRARLIR